MLFAYYYTHTEELQWIMGVPQITYGCATINAWMGHKDLWMFHKKCLDGPSGLWSMVQSQQIYIAILNLTSKESWFPTVRIYFRHTCLNPANWLNLFLKKQLKSDERLCFKPKQLTTGYSGSP